MIRIVAEAPRWRKTIWYQSGCCTRKPGFCQSQCGIYARAGTPPGPWPFGLPSPPELPPQSSLPLSLSLSLAFSITTQSPETRHLIPVDRGAIARDLRDSIIPVGLLLPVKVVGAAVPATNDRHLGT